MERKPNPEEVRKILNSLSKQEVEQIHKTNVFRNERNAKIRELLDRGVKINVLAEITGFTRSHIRTIKNHGFKILN